MISICEPLPSHKIINGYCINCGGKGGTPGPCDIIPDEAPKAKTKAKPKVYSEPGLEKSSKISKKSILDQLEKNLAGKKVSSKQLNEMVKKGDFAGVLLESHKAMWEKAATYRDTTGDYLRGKGDQNGAIKTSLQNTQTGYERTIYNAMMKVMYGGKAKGGVPNVGAHITVTRGEADRALATIAQVKASIPRYAAIPDSALD